MLDKLLDTERPFGHAVDLLMQWIVADPFHAFVIPLVLFLMGFILQAVFRSQEIPFEEITARTVFEGEAQGDTNAWSADCEDDEEEDDEDE